jgi:hypothetical protein
MAKKEFPEIKEKNEGKFTAWVEKNMGGIDTCKAASKVMRSRTKKYSPAVVKMANYANNFGCKTKKEDGASMKGKRSAIKELDKRSDQKVKTGKKDNVKKLTLTRRPGGLNESVEKYKGSHVDAKSTTSFSKTGKNITASRKIDGTLHMTGESAGSTGKKGKTVVKDNTGKTVYKTDRKGNRTVKKLGVPKSKKK